MNDDNLKTGTFLLPELNSNNNNKLKIKNNNKKKETLK